MEHATSSHLNGLYYNTNTPAAAMNRRETMDSVSRATAMGRRRASSFHYDAAATMDRMRHSMMGGGNILKQQTTLHDALTSLDRAVSEEQRQQDDRQRRGSFLVDKLGKAAGQIPAIALLGMFHLMIGIPFGVSYFPIGWSAAGSTEASTDDLVRGTFPIEGKEALGIRMFLFSTIIGQLMFVPFSGFANPIGLNMVENVPFTHALSLLVIKHQGYGTEALSTLFVLFGLSSVIVGIVFYTLGKLQLGRVVHYFPTHVLVGLIAGIGVFLAKTGMEVTMNAVFSPQTFVDNFHLTWIVFLLEAVLRILDYVLRDANLSLLSPIYFCLITPVFYMGLWLFRINVDDANDAGYFFPSLSDDASIWNEDLFDMWRVVDIRNVSMPAIVDSIPTLVALTLFSLIHVPINIPAFALSTNVEVDMNQELIAHGYSNMLSGIFGGLQNYMAYTQSVIYDKSGGTGKASGYCVAALTIVLYFIGPTVASYIPRCMAGTLLLHVGIDLFLEGAYDSLFKFDRLEYASVMIIIVVMTLYGMDAAMMAGVLCAISTFVAQNMTYVGPVRGSMSAATLRSDSRSRNHAARAILDDATKGRSRILVIQLQGHLFFGNLANLQKTVHDIMEERWNTDDQPIVVIVDFSLVLGVDSSAAQAITRLKRVLNTEFSVEVSIFVSGSPYGFPTAFDLSRELAAQMSSMIVNKKVDDVEEANETTGLLLQGQQEPQQNDMKRVCSKSELDTMLQFGSHVTETLNMALVYAENCLIGRQDPSLLEDSGSTALQLLRASSSMSEEKDVALHYLVNLVPMETRPATVEQLFSHFQRESYMKDDYLWKQGTSSTSIKLLLRGTLIAVLENEAGTSETIGAGNVIGESGVIEGVPRLSTVKCLTDEAVVYSLSKESYETLLEESPQVARLVDLICINYLSARVQHVSNRIFETRCLPI